MLVYILSAFVDPAKVETSTVRWLRESAEADPFGQHRITREVEAADMILFAQSHPRIDPYLMSVRRHPIYRKYREKCFLYQDGDFAVPIIRGVYPSIRRRDYQAERCRSGGYIARLHPNEAIRYDPGFSDRKWLYSLFGEANSPIRKALLGRAHPRGLVRDTTGRHLWEMDSDQEREAFTRDYAEAIRDSRFVLCPAGLGPLTYRLFETMEMGRVPVILSDEWVPIQGPAWNDFSLRIPEHRVADLESILDEHASRHEEMGRLARLAWEEWFDKRVCFHRLVELCLELKALQPGLRSDLRAWRSLMRSPHFVRWLRPHYIRGKDRVKSLIRRAPPREN
jgi:hypothetical protein